MNEGMQIPQYIDNPPQWMWWESDEIAPIGVLIGIGMITHTLTLCIFLSWGFYKLFLYFKGRHLRGYFAHIAYRIGLVPLNRRFPNGAITYYHV